MKRTDVAQKELLLLAVAHTTVSRSCVSTNSRSNEYLWHAQLDDAVNSVVMFCSSHTLPLLLLILMALSIFITGY